MMSLLSMMPRMVQQLRGVEAEDVDGVFGGGGSGEPAARGVFEEMVVEVVDTEIDEGDAALLQGRRGPEGMFDAVAVGEVADKNDVILAKLLKLNRIKDFLQRAVIYKKNIIKMFCL